MFFIKSFNIFFTFLISLVIFICLFFIPQNNNNLEYINSVDLSADILWPSPNYYKINSPYGKRNAPATGASTFHKGIDIGAPEGSPFIAVKSGIITFADFLGGGGYTITLTDDTTTNGEIKYSYCHCNPNFIVSVGMHVEKGQIIGYVGPKYVYGVPGNKYKDSSGKPTNGATTGPHLHFRSPNK